MKRASCTILKTTVVAFVHARLLWQGTIQKNGTARDDETQYSVQPMHLSSPAWLESCAVGQGLLAVFSRTPKDGPRPF